MVGGGAGPGHRERASGKGKEGKGNEGKGGDAKAPENSAPAGSLRARRSEQAKGRGTGKGKGQGKDTGQDPAADQKPEKSLAVRIAGPAAFVFVLVFAGFLGLYDGGPDSERAGGTPIPKIDDWAMTASLPDGTSRVLCDTDTTECTLEDLWPAVEAGWECSFSARVWLTTGSNPVLLRGVRLETVNVTTMGGNPDFNGTEDANATNGDTDDNATRQPPANFTMDFHEEELDQAEGLWLRSVAKRVEFEVPVNCDSLSVTLRADLTGKRLFGGEWSASKRATQLIHRDLSGITGLPDDFDARANRA